MGLFKKVFKGIGKVFKKIGKGVKSVFKKFGKFMNKIGIVGQIAMMFILPGIGAALAKGFGAIWTGVVGQTAAQATATSLGTAAGATTTTSLAATEATKLALKEGATQAAANAAGEAVKQTAINAATKAATVSIRAGTQAITQQATGMLASEYAIVKGAGMVLQKGAQFASTIASGYKTVSQAVTGAFTETGKWIGGKLGMKTAEGAAMQGSWANYSKAVTDSFNDFKGNVADFWSPIKDGPTIDVGIKELTNEVADATGKVVTSTSNIASATGSDLNVSGEFGTDFTGSSTPRRVGGEYGFEIEIDKLNTVVTEPTVDFGSSTGFDVTDPTNLNRSLLDRTATYITDTPNRLYKGAIDFVAQTPGRVLQSEATGALYGAAGLTPEPLAIEEPLNLWDQAGYTPQLNVGNADIYAQTMGYDFGNQMQSFIVPVNETGYYGGPSIKDYTARMKSFTNNPNTGVA